MTLTVKSVRQRTATIAADEADSRYRHLEKFIKACKACPNYGTVWSCPPFDSDDRPSGKFLTVVLLTVELEHHGESAGQQELLREVRRIIADIRSEHEPILLQVEHNCGGNAVLYTGMCHHCGDERCARIDGKPCRHPKHVRPSLEALGYDLEAMSRELFDEPLEWFADGWPPAKLNLLAGLFSDEPQL